MKGIIKGFVICLAISNLVTTAQAALTEAEEAAINSGNPRDCSLFVDARKKTECADFNKALIECRTTGFRVGKELKACMVKKGQIRR